MLKFTVPAASESVISAAAVNSIPIEAVVFYNGDNAQVTFLSSEGKFIGNVVRDESGIGDYVVIDLEDTSSSSYTVTKIVLKRVDSELVIAESPDISLVKQANKQLKLRLTAQFEGATKCTFGTISIGLPYATKNRQGVIRLTSPQDVPSSSDDADTIARKNQQLESTVYSARDTIAKIEEYIHSAGQYVPWDADQGTHEPVQGQLTVEDLHFVSDYTAANPGTATVTVDSSNNLVVNNPITGTAVSSAPNYGSTTVATSAITGSSALVNETYISSLYSNSIASDNTSADARKLVTSYAVKSYIDDTNNNLVHKAGAETISGAKTFTANIVTGDSTHDVIITGTAVQSQYQYVVNSQDVYWDDQANYSKLPTVEVVHDALDALDTSITEAYTAADSGLRSDLQSQIDGINAGQNLADMVATKAALDALSTTNLQDGDKVQVLADETHDSASTVYTLSKPESGTPSWTYVGKYGQDSYTKAESDGKYFLKNNVATITTMSQHETAEDYVPSMNAVKSMIGTAGSQYVKLSSASTQTIASPISIKQSASSTAILSISDGQSISSSESLTVSANNSTHSVVTEYNLVNNSVGNYTVKLDGTSALSLATTSSVADVSGSLVASYRDYQASGASLTDGRLVTVDYLTNYAGNMSDYAKLEDDNTFTGSNTFENTTTFETVSADSYTGDGIYDTYNASTWNTSSSPAASTDTANKIPTVSAVDGAITDKLTSMGNINEVGSMGLFIYTESASGAELGYGAVVAGSYLKPVGMSLPMSGQISYKAVTIIDPNTGSNQLSGSWKLLSVAVKRTVTEPCLVLAIKVSDNEPT